MDDDLAKLEFLLNDIGTITAFSERNYSYLVNHLRTCSCYPTMKNRRKQLVNTGLNFVLDGYHMTGLEWAVHRNDWKTAAILFYFGGADPMHNAFDGMARFELEEILEANGEDGLYPTFEEAKIVPGFVGLERLVYDNDDHDRNDHGRAHLWIMELLSSLRIRSDGSGGCGEEDDTDTDTGVDMNTNGDSKLTIFTIHRSLPELMNRIDLVSYDLDISQMECMDFVRSMIMCMQRVGLPNELAVRIAEESLLNKLWLLSEDFGLSGIDE